MTDVEVADAAATLADARRTREAIDRLSQRHPLMTIADAYRVQMRQVDALVAAGDRVRGYKIGLTSAAMRAQMGVDEPDFGHLLASTFVTDTIDMSQLIQPLAEPEIAVALTSELRGPGLAPSDVRQAIGALYPSLEVVDSRIRDWNVLITDTVADNASAGRVVLGDSTASIYEIDIDDITCTLHVNGEEMHSGTSRDTMGSPILAVTWLANTLGSFGVALSAGSIILTGALTTAVRLQPGTTVEARFGQLGAAGVAVVTSGL